jgi:hypothetical protein
MARGWMQRWGSAHRLHEDERIHHSSCTTQPRHRTARPAFGARAPGVATVLTQRGHDFTPGDRTAGCPQRLEAAHGTRRPFHCPLVLRHEGIEILRGAKNDRGLVRRVVGCCCKNFTIVENARSAMLSYNSTGGEESGGWSSRGVIFRRRLSYGEEGRATQGEER